MFKEKSSEKRQKGDGKKEVHSLRKRREKYRTELGYRTESRGEERDADENVKRDGMRDLDPPSSLFLSHSTLELAPLSWF